MIGNAHRANPLSHALRRASSPERGSFFCVAARFACPGVTPSVKKSGSETPAGVSEPQIIIIIFSAVQAFSEGLLRSTLRMILRTGRMLLAFMDSSSTPMRRKVSVRAVSAPSSPQMPTQMP